MTLIGLAGPAARGNAEIKADRVDGNGLQKMKHVQSKQHRDIQFEAGSAGSIRTSKRCHKYSQACT